MRSGKCRMPEREGRMPVRGTNGSARRKGEDMGLFKRKKEQNTEKIPFDPQKEYAVLRCSICNGEQVAGFKDRNTGHFTEVCLIRGERELEAFKQTYGITEITKEY